MAWFKCGGGGGGIPAILKNAMNTVFNKKFGTSETYAPEAWPDEVNLLGALEEKTVSGSVVAFADGADDVPLKSASFSIVASGGGGTPSTPVPIVGKSSVTVYQTGKNLISNSASAWESGTINSSGNNASGSGTRTIGYFDIKGGLNYKISGVIAPETASDFRIFFYDKNKVFLTYRNYNSTPTIPENACFFRVRNISVADISTLQIEYGDTATAYEAYKSKTPITVALGQTVYGGTLAEDGTLTLTHEIVTLSESQIDNASSYTYSTKVGIQISNAFPDNIIRTETNENDSSHDIVKRGSDSASHYMWFGSANGSKYLYWVGILDFLSMTLEQWQVWAKTQTIQLRYPLATPIVITGLDEISISTYLGDNSIWCDSGDTEVVYRSSGTQTLIPPTLISKTITQNGTYSAEDDNADGYDEVTVNVPTGTTDPFKVLSINGTAGTETFTADTAGTYMFLVATSEQGTATITSAITPDLTFSKRSRGNRGLEGAIYTLAVGDTVTMSNTVDSWVYNTKVVVEMNISVSAVIDSAIKDDGTLPTFSPSITGNALFISMAGGRFDDTSYDRTYTDLNSFEFFGKVETGLFLRIRYGSTVPNYQLYGYDGGCALAIALSVNNPPVLLMGGLGNPGPVNEPEQEEPDAAPEEQEEIQEETPEEVDQNESDE